MSQEELRFSMRDCFDAAKAARELERGGCAVDKSEGYYMDELAVYAAELKRRS